MRIVQTKLEFTWRTERPNYTWGPRGLTWGQTNMHCVHPPCAYLAQDLDPRITNILFFLSYRGQYFSNVTKKIYLKRVQHSYKTQQQKGSKNNCRLHQAIKDGWFQIGPDTHQWLNQNPVNGGCNPKYDASSIPETSCWRCHKHRKPDL